MATVQELMADPRWQRPGPSPATDEARTVQELMADPRWQRPTAPAPDTSILQPGPAVETPNDGWWANARHVMQSALHGLFAGAPTEYNPLGAGVEGQAPPMANPLTIFSKGGPQLLSGRAGTVPEGMAEQYGPARTPGQTSIPGFAQVGPAPSKIAEVVGNIAEAYTANPLLATMNPALTGIAAGGGELAAQAFPEHPDLARLEVRSVRGWL